MIVVLTSSICGIVIGERFEYGSDIALGLCIVGMLQFLLAIFSWRKSKRSKMAERGVQFEEKKSKTFSIPLLSGIFFIVMSLFIVRVQFVSEPVIFVCDEVCSFEGVVTEAPSISEAGQVVIVEPDSAIDVYNVTVRLPLYPAVHVGERIVLTGKVAPPKNSMQHDGKQTFDYRSYLHLHGVGSEMYYPKLEIQNGMRVESIVVRLMRVRETLVTQLTTYVDEPSASLASGMLFGDNSMSKEMINTFRVAGISHIIVLSGFNIAILISFVLLVLAFVPLLVRVMLASTFVVMFVLMVGGEVSVIRATLMSFCALIALMLGRGYVARQALLWSLILIALYQPLHVLYDVSLHLSFLATAGIVYGVEILDKRLVWIRIQSYREIFATTLAAYLATLPYVLYTFGTMSMYALLANMLVLPLVPVMMLTSFFVVMSSYVSHTLAVVFGYITTLLGTLLITVAKIIEGLPFASLSISISSTSLCVMYISIIILFIVLAHSDRHTQDDDDETNETKNDEILSGVISY